LNGESLGGVHNTHLFFHSNIFSFEHFLTAQEEGKINLTQILRILCVIFIIAACNHYLINHVWKYNTQKGISSFFILAWFNLNNSATLVLNKKWLIPSKYIIYANKPHETCFLICGTIKWFEMRVKEVTWKMSAAPTSSRFYMILAWFCHDYVMIHLVWLAVLPA
jgi:hypothetical protein